MPHTSSGVTHRSPVGVWLSGIGRCDGSEKTSGWGSRLLLGGSVERQGIHSLVLGEGKGREVGVVWIGCRSDRLSDARWLSGNVWAVRYLARGGERWWCCWGRGSRCSVRMLMLCVTTACSGGSYGRGLLGGLSC